MKFLVLAKNREMANRLIRSRRLPPSDCAYVDRVERIYSVYGAAVLIHPSFGSHPRFAEIDSYVRQRINVGHLHEDPLVTVRRSVR